MLHPLPPPQPPALIENVEPKIVRDFSNSDYQTNSVIPTSAHSKEPNTERISANQETLRPSPPPQEQYLPEFSSQSRTNQCQQINMADSSPCRLQEETDNKNNRENGEEYISQTDADSLGSPLEPDITEDNSHLVIPSLNQSGISQSTIILTQERDGETREFQINPVPAENVSSVTPTWSGEGMKRNKPLAISKWAPVGRGTRIGPRPPGSDRRRAARADRRLAGTHRR